MTKDRARAQAAIGLTVKSGWAAAVLVAGSVAEPRVVDSRRIELSDPALPDSRQPYHAGFGTARDAGPELAQLVAGVKRFGQRAVTSLIGEYQKLGHALRGAGVVVGSLADPANIANDHIRIHALEGQLFRQIVHDAVSGSQLPCSVWRERDLQALAAEHLNLPEAKTREMLATLGRHVAGPWRVEQKSAALAAWLVTARTPARWKPAANSRKLAAGS